jgi:hypothetical protein
MQNVNKQQAMPKIRIPKTPQNLFIKKGDEVKQEVKQPPIVVKHIDELYSKAFLNEYFLINIK